MIVKVLIEISSHAIDRTFTYNVPKKLEEKIKVGKRVKVPFSSQILEGFILEISYKNDTLEDFSYDLKEVIDVVDEEVILTDELLDLGKYVSKKTFSTLISSYQAMLPRALKAKNKVNDKKKLECFIEINNLMDKSFSSRQLEIINLLKDSKKLYSELKKINSSVDTLLKYGILKKTYIEKYRLNNNEICENSKKVLTTEQMNVFNEIKNNLNNNIVYLLHGVTGSGKTEIYMEIIENVINEKKQALLLVPEITLTNQILMRFRKRFSRIAILHSGLSDGEKYDEYRKIKRCEVDIVIGARSAIFAPLDNIGVIILDECHSDTYRQDNMPRYDSIDIAEYRGKYHNCPVILGSATPTLMMYAKAKRGIYQLITLDKRIGKSVMPEIILCDMTKEERLKNTSISKKLFDAINDCILNNNQSILLINRRGYSNIIMCKNCGYIFKCPNCDISLTYHKTSDFLRCHYCGYATKLIKECPNCHMDSINELGCGTEKIEEELKKIISNVRIVRMDLDTTTKKGSHEKIINDFADHKYDILLGTQMISKGLDFPNVTLVGVINADTSLFIPSYKSSENTFQLLSQVAGRSGRGDKKGRVLIQSYNTDHYAIMLATKNNYLDFYNYEMKVRLINKYPPFYYLVYITIKSKDNKLLSMEANKIYSILGNHLENTLILGPSICSPYKLNNVFRLGIILKYKKEDQLNETLNMLIEHYRNNNRIDIDINLNPNNI